MRSSPLLYRLRLLYVLLLVLDGRDGCLMRNMAKSRWWLLRMGMHSEVVRLPVGTVHVSIRAYAVLVSFAPIRLLVVAMRVLVDTVARVSTDRPVLVFVRV